MLAEIPDFFIIAPPKKAAIPWLVFPRALPLLLLAAIPLTAAASACKTQSQMTAAQRDALSNAARTLISDVQSGDVQAMRANTIPAVAADFGGIANSAETLKPLVQQAIVTVDSLYTLDATADAPGAAHTDFYCGTPVVV